MYEVEGRTPNFNPNPVVVFDDVPTIAGYEAVAEELNKAIAKMEGDKKVVVLDSYYGVDLDVVNEKLIKALNPDCVVRVADALLPPDVVEKKFEKFIVPSDRSYGVFAVGTMDEFFDEEKLAELQQKVAQATGTVVVYGVAAGYVTEEGLKVYCNLANDTYTDLLNAGLKNYAVNNLEEEPLGKQKRQTFMELPLMEKYKSRHLVGADYYLDFADIEKPVLLDNDEFKKMAERLSKQPFQMHPFFMKAIWGGDWIQKVFGVHKDWENVGWGMTGIFFFQHVDLMLGGNRVPVFGTDLLFYEPLKYLGGSVYYKWGYRVPFTTSYLDTWGGGNLSLQVHSIASYGQETFNARAGHHETYYMMDTGDHSSVYLGLKEGTKVSEMVADLKKAQETGEFDDSKYVNKIPMQKHQHVFIPGGTVHCSGEGTCVLEIDQYVYATFKLFDWGRIDYDGKPRPVNIDHGQYCIQENYQGDFVYDRLISKQPTIEEGEGYRIDDTSPIEYEPLDIKRYWFSDKVEIECNDAIADMTIVEGEEAILESIDGSFEPLVIHYGECTFIPANVGKYTIRPYGRSEGKEVAIVKVSYPSMA